MHRMALVHGKRHAVLHNFADSNLALQKASIHGLRNDLLANVWKLFLLVYYFVGESLVSLSIRHNDLYIRPWTRIAAYEVGVLFGMFYFEWMNKNRRAILANSLGTILFQSVYNFRIVRYTFYIVGLIIINGLMIMQHAETRDVPKQYFSQIVHSLFNAVSRPLFVFGLALILMGPLTGRNKLMRFVLGSNGYSPWAKVSFMAYLIHLLVFKYFYSQTRQSVYITHKDVIFSLAAVLLLSLFISIPFSALFEAPFLQLEKLVIFPEKPKSEQEDSIVTEDSHIMKNIKRGNINASVDSLLTEANTKG
mmetsp:Transcript_43559/g.51285  ORF Transcript_43559/g.51285 Transcript_43559/m.51285 type:complete len:307 (-) Transcript_43559:33-953(-)